MATPFSGTQPLPIYVRLKWTAPAPERLLALGGTLGRIGTAVMHKGHLDSPLGEPPPRARNAAADVTEHSLMVKSYRGEATTKRLSSE